MMFWYFWSSLNRRLITCCCIRFFISCESFLNVKSVADEMPLSYFEHDSLNVEKVRLSSYPQAWMHSHTHTKISLISSPIRSVDRRLRFLFGPSAPKNAHQFSVLQTKEPMAFQAHRTNHSQLRHFNHPIDYHNLAFGFFLLLEHDTFATEVYLLISHWPRAYKPHIHINLAEPIR